MDIIIIGNGVAGVTVAETIRAADKTSGITVLTSEPQPFYSRPRLIEFLAGTASAEQITIHPRAWYEKNTIVLVDNVFITRADISAKAVYDKNGNKYPYDKLVVASGATSFLPPVPGVNLPNVFTLRTLADADTIRKTARERNDALVIGGGLLGIEVANSLIALGAKVRVIEIFDRLLPRQLDQEGSALIRLLLEKKGMTFATGKQTESIEQNNGSLAVKLKGGESVGADFVLFSAGIRPDAACVKDTGIARNKGIIVDEFMRTNVADVYACGDVAEFNGILFGLWQPAREQALACGNHIIGKETPFKASVPSTRLKVAGIEFASIGEIELEEGMAFSVEKDEEKGFYKKLLTRDNRLVGAMLIGNVKDAVKLQQEIKGNK